MLVFDTEGDGFVEDMSKLHCLNIIDRTTGARLRFNDHPELAARPPDGSLEEGARLLMEAEEIGGHNIIAHDIPAIQKIFPWFAPKGRVKDSLVYSRVIWTDLKDIDFKAIRRRKRPPEFEKRHLIGRHSLEAWGYRLMAYKGDYGPMMEERGKALGLTGDDLLAYVWGTFNPEMDDYCEQDCEVTVKLFEKIEDTGYSEESLELETQVAKIIDMQRAYGVLIDVPAAERLAGEMTAALASLDEQLRAAFLPWYAPVVEKGRVAVRQPSRRSWIKGVTSDDEIVKFPVDAGASYCPVKLVEFKASSRDHIADRLKKLYSWQPQEFTPSGKPKVDETTLDGLDFPQKRLLLDYLVIAKSLGTLATGDKSILKFVGKDGRMHPKVNSNGAVTGRMTHYDPNVNFPKVKPGEDGKPLLGVAGGFGVELRSLVTVPKGRKLVGVDAEGLEDRMLAHHMGRYDGGAYTDTLLNGDKKKGTDNHSITTRLIGLNLRDSGKRWRYAYLYGAGNWKLGAIQYDDMTEEQREAFNAKYPPGKPRNDALTRLGAAGRKKIEVGFPALGALQAKIQEKARSGSLRGLDGRKLHVRGQHSALNTLLQGGGAIVMKKALVLAYEAFTAKGWEFGRDYAFVLNVHDEFQIEAEEHIAKEIGAIAADAIRQAGEAFNLRCPLAGSQDIGDNWALTH
ncbi:DNA polymerase [Sphingopyxis flava]|uniref:DNA-directed DNA polymerase n=1 Tax=Sphingopyxis flava TaxID=1507287 RepID=A0A1T5BQU4_9SPHN|nr:DNA polymerase [Sphingopyxis flava]SKB49469.1 DNA polymerase I-3'-5' exonuclease and polymerase domains [Sphingopyxis flava]